MRIAPLQHVKSAPMTHPVHYTEVKKAEIIKKNAAVQVQIYVHVCDGWMMVLFNL